MEGASESLLVRVASLFNYFQYPKGTIIQWGREPSDTLWFIETGEVRINRCQHT
jgi:CRP-like cAMP-binding protein